MLIVNNSQMKHLDGIYIDKFDQKVLRKIREIYPDKTKIKSDSDLLGIIKLRRDQCISLSIKTEKSIFLFITLAFIFGEGVYKEINFKKFIAQSGVSGDIFIQRLFKKINSEK